VVWLISTNVLDKSVYQTTLCKIKECRNFRLWVYSFKANVVSFFSVMLFEGLRHGVL